LQSLPSLPAMPSVFRFSWPRVPERLLPWGIQKWNQMSSRHEFRQSQVEMIEIAKADEAPSVTGAAMAGGATGMITVSLTFLIGVTVAGGRRRRKRDGEQKPASY